MKKTLLLTSAFAFLAAFTGCATEETTNVDAGYDTTMVAPVEPLPAPMPGDTTMMAPGDTTMMDGTDAGVGTDAGDGTVGQ